MIPTIPFQTKIRFQSKQKLNKVSIWQNKQEKGFRFVSFRELPHFLKTKELRIPKKFSICLDLIFFSTNVKKKSLFYQIYQK